MRQPPVFCRALPRKVSLAGQFCPIDTNFRTWILLTLQLEEKEKSPEEKAAALLSVFSSPPGHLPEALAALAKFYHRERPIPKHGSKQGGGPLFSFAEDGSLLAASFLAVYGLDLYALPYLHWWQFLELLEGLPDSCALKQRIALRALDLSSVKDPARRRQLAQAQAAVSLGTDLNDGDIAAQFWIEGGRDHANQ